MIPARRRSQYSVSRAVLVTLTLLGLSRPTCLIAQDLIAKEIQATSYQDFGNRSLGSDVKNADFVIVTQVFQDEREAPVETHRIAFSEGAFYDFPDGEARSWTLFDLPNSQVVIFDRQKHQLTSTPTDRLVKLSAKAEASITAAEQRERLGMNAKVENTSSTTFTLTYPGTRYQVTGTSPTHPEVAIQYGRFVDWACRLNISRPRGTPPFARIKLNEVMTQRHLLPVRIDVEMLRSLGDAATPVKLKLRSETRIVPELGDEIQKKIAETRKMRVLFETIPWDQYEH